MIKFLWIFVFFTVTSSYAGGPEKQIKEEALDSLKSEEKIEKSVLCFEKHSTVETLKSLETDVTLSYDLWKTYAIYDSSALGTTKLNAMFKKIAQCNLVFQQKYPELTSSHKKQFINALLAFPHIIDRPQAEDCERLAMLFEHPNQCVNRDVHWMGHENLLKVYCTRTRSE